MAVNIVSLVMEFLTPDMIGRMASMLGVDRTIAQSAINTAVPSLLAGFSNVAAQPGGAQKLADAATQQAGALEGFSRMLGTGKQSAFIESGSQMLSSLLGNQDQNTLSRVIGRFTGIEQGATGSLLGMLAPAVLGIITRQLGPRVGPSGIADLLTSQKQNIAAALPSGFANQVVGTGLLDSIGGAARATAAESSEALRRSASTAGAAVSDTARRAAAASAPGNWVYWLIPAAAIAAALVFLVTRPAQQIAPRDATTGQATTLASLDVGEQVTNIVAGLRTTLGGITDAASAQAALPALREADAQMDKLGGLSKQLSAEQRKAVASAVNPTMPTLNQLLDKVLAVPGAAEVLKPTVDDLKAKLAALTT